MRISRPGGGWCIALARSIRPLSIVLPVFAAMALSACSAVERQLAAGMAYENAAIYPIRSPEYVLRDLGHQRYLLGQQEVDSRGDRRQHARYVDLRSGITTDIQSRHIELSRSANVRGDVPIRLSSDDPRIVVFLERGLWESPYEEGCKGIIPYEVWLTRYCGLMRIQLSLDGGKSFAMAQVRIPNVLESAVRGNTFSFLEVRERTLYIGVFVDNRDRYFSDRADELQRNRAGVAIARFKRSPEFGYESLVILSMPLPPDEPAAQSASATPFDFVADRLVGKRLVDYPVAATMATLHERMPAELVVPDGAENHRSIRSKYVESLRGKYPGWAAKQYVDIPEDTHHEGDRARDKRLARLPSMTDDPVEWVDFTRVPR